MSSFAALTIEVLPDGEWRWCLRSGRTMVVSASPSEPHARRAGEIEARSRGWTIGEPAVGEPTIRERAVGEPWRDLAAGQRSASRP